jgi:glycerol-3-phosphate cytidylyltransferase
MKFGYTTGVYDLFHVGHVKLLNQAKLLCDRLIVGVSTDELVKEYKKRTPLIPFEERVEILSNIRCVDLVVPQNSMDKFEAWNRYKFDFMFVGDDWYKTPSWENLEKRFSDVGVKIVYFPYTKTTSSTKINNALDLLTQDSVNLGCCCSISANK